MKEERGEITVKKGKNDERMGLSKIVNFSQ